MEYRVNLCRSVPQAVLCLPREIRADRPGTDIAEGMRELAATAARAGLTTSGPATITFTEGTSPTGSTLVDFGVPVEPAPGLGPASGAVLVVQPDLLVARTSHRGGYGKLDAAYRALREWIRDNGYRPTGPPTEVYLIGPDEVTDARQLITEIRIPVTRAPGIAVHLDATFEAAVARTREALRRQGFGVITEIDVQATLREKLGEHIENYLILGACNPRLADRALAADREAGLLLPCNVVVRSADTGTIVEAADPDVLVDATGVPALRPVAEEARRLLTAALHDLREYSHTTP